MDEASFDYIIVGAGSAGCVLANRLSADPRHRVALVEGGPSDRDILVQMPRGYARMLNDPKHVWLYPVKNGGRLDDTEVWYRGRKLGGSSSVNGQVYVRGQPQDYDSWEKAGCTGWGWSDIIKCFRAFEDHELGRTEFRGAGGPLKITNPPASQRVALCDAVIAAAAQAGVPIKEDLNTPDQEGVGYHQRTIWRGQRQSSATAFLDPVRSRANLEVCTDTVATRIEFDGRRAIGVRVRTEGRERVLRSREIILSAGAIGSPQLLQLSGIGPGALLHSVGVEVLFDAPDVGRNLREQRLLMLQFEVSSGSLNAEFRGLGLMANVLKYQFLRSGALTGCAFEVGGFFKTRPELDRPDAQLMMGPVLMGLDRRGAMTTREQHGLICGGYVMRPESRGVLAITGATIEDPLDIDPNYFAAAEDQRASVEILRFIRRMFTQPAMTGYAPHEVLPGADVETDEAIVEAYQRFGSSAAHAAGTCRMGADAASVLDPQLRVRGVDGLRVADISIMPTLTSGNTNAPAMAIGWRAADLILAADG